jgi:hypothetical protein
MQATIFQGAEEVSTLSIGPGQGNNWYELVHAPSQAYVVDCILVNTNSGSPLTFSLAYGTANPASFVISNFQIPANAGQAGTPAVDLLALLPATITQIPGSAGIGLWVDLGANLGSGIGLGAVAYWHRV